MGDSLVPCVRVPEWARSGRPMRCAKVGGVGGDHSGASAGFDAHVADACMRPSMESAQIGRACVFDDAWPEWLQQVPVLAR